MADMTGAEHWDEAARILAAMASGNRRDDAEWVQANATRALAHAMLANAARDYGKHVAPQPKYGVSTVTGKPNTGIISVDLGLETEEAFRERYKRQAAKETRKPRKIN